MFFLFFLYEGKFQSQLGCSDILRMLSIVSLWPNKCSTDVDHVMQCWPSLQWFPFRLESEHSLYHQPPFCTPAHPTFVSLSNVENGMFFAENDNCDLFPNASTVEKPLFNYLPKYTNNATVYSIRYSNKKYAIWYKGRSYTELVLLACCACLQVTHVLVYFADVINV